MDPSELEAVSRAASEAGVVVAEAFMYRHHPQIAELRRLLADGTLGDLVALEARLHFELDRVEGATDIRLDPAMGGGSLRDLGCYPVDLFGLLTDAEPDEVSAVAVRDEDGGVDTRFAAVLRYGPVVATLDCSFDTAFRNTATVIGSKGTVLLADVFRADRHGGAASLVLETDGGRREIRCEGDQYAAEVAGFASRVAERRGDEQDWQLTAYTTRTVARLAAAAG
jgi:predicted dehydrogenase